MVGINNFALASAETPFGGVKESGFGREGGPTAIHEYLIPKLVKTEL
jgi:succinate-semialdehyde dehydrogenase/glutarate-semialdehyde dehydrogenase